MYKNITISLQKDESLKGSLSDFNYESSSNLPLL